MTNIEKAEKLERAAGLLDTAASAYRHGRMSTAHTKTAAALNVIADVTVDEGWKVDVELREDGDA